MSNKLKLNYYGYYLEEGENRYKSDLRPLLRQYAQTPNKPIFKRTGSSDWLFLSEIPLVKDCYMLIQSNDSELIKAVNTQNSTHKDIMKKLEQNEKIGFAAILYIQPSFFGMVRALRAPGDKAFIEWLHKAFVCIGKEKLQAVSFMFPTHTTKEDIRSFSVLRSAYLRLNKNSSHARTFIAEFFGKEPKELWGFDITIKPNHGKDLPELPDMVERLNLNDLELLKIKAKEQLGDALNDYFLVGEGHVSESIVKASELDMAKEIITKTENLKSKLEQGIRDEEKAKPTDKDDRLLFSNVSFDGIIC